MSIEPVTLDFIDAAPEILEQKPKTDEDRPKMCKYVKSDVYGLCTFWTVLFAE